MFDLSTQIAAFLDYCQNRKSFNVKTINAYSIDLKQFASHAQNEFNKEVLCSYLVFLHNTYKPKTVKRKIATLKALTHYLMIEDIIDINPFSKIETAFREPYSSSQNHSNQRNKRYFSRSIYSVFICRFRIQQKNCHTGYCSIRVTFCYRSKGFRDMLIKININQLNRLYNKILRQRL